MVNYNQAYLESLVKPGSTKLSILVDNCQKPGKSGSTRVYQVHQAFNQTFGARDIIIILRSYTSGNCLLLVGQHSVVSLGDFECWLRQSCKV